MPPLLIVMLGGAIGAGFRYHVSLVALRNLGAGFPWGTWFINLLGGFLMGMLAAVITRDGRVDQPLWLFLGTGLLGGFTTFSAFSLDTFGMLQRGDPVMAACYAVSSVAGSIMLLICGYYLVRTIA